MSKRPNEYIMEDQQPSKKFHDDNYNIFSKPSVPVINFERADPKIYIKNTVLLNALMKKGIKNLFPIQYQTFNTIYKDCDLIARDRTGSGKTLAFTLPVLERFFNQDLFVKVERKCKFLIVLPTRELALQVKAEIQSLTNNINQKSFSVVAVYGGASIQDQVYSLRRGCDVIVGTPGRLIDLLNRRQISLEQLRVACLDQADQMLNKGFQQDIQKIFEFIAKQSKIKPQFLMFSATIPEWMYQISEKYQNPNKKTQIIDLIGNSGEVNCTSKTVEHRKVKCQSISKQSAIRQLIWHYCNNESNDKHRVLIFCETKRQVNQVGRTYNFGMRVGVLHGDIPQATRQRVFRDFKQGYLRCVVATNVAARGLDFPQVALVIQFQPPKNTESYVHRSGRTGRAGKNGVCVTLYDGRDKSLFYRIQRQAKIAIREIDFNNFEQKSRYSDDSRKKIQSAVYKENQKWSAEVTEDQASQAKKRKDQLEIFIGGVGRDVGDDHLKRFFEKHYVKVINVKCLKDREGNSKGVAFALCANDVHLNRALELDKCRFEGNYLKISLAKIKP